MLVGIRAVRIYCGWVSDDKDKTHRVARDEEDTRKEHALVDRLGRSKEVKV